MLQDRTSTEIHISSFLLCLCHFICEVCDPTLAFDYVANLSPVVFTKANKWFSIMLVFQEQCQNYPKPELSVWLLRKITVNFKKKKKHIKPLVRYDLNFRAGVRCLLKWVEVIHKKWEFRVAYFVLFR